MNGLRDIFLSCVLALAATVTLTRILEKEPHQPPPDEPVTSTGEITDDNLSLTWGLRQIHAEEAWKNHRGSKDIIVAVIDTGCDIHHPDLAENLWRNPGESGLDENGMPKAANGIDDDDNGFVDDFHGWNFSSNTSDLEDEHGHGTHIAGIIGAHRLNGFGPTGIAPHVSLMILKYFDHDASGKDNLNHTVAAIRYAVNMGADIINYSGGGSMKSAAEEEALNWAASQGVLVVAAAGNEGLNSDFYPFYPADYKLPNILSVAATDRTEGLMNMSNFGVQSVHLAAPGKNIFSTLPNGQYGYMSGTSQATAFVSGVAALLMANDFQLHEPQALIAHLLKHSAARPKLKGKVRSGAMLDAQKALESSDRNLVQLSQDDN